MNKAFSFALALFAFAALAVHAADDPTAFELIEEGNKYVGEQAKDKIVQIRSEKSVGSLNPRIWSVVYYDPTATFKSVEVKFAAGKMTDVKRPFRLIERVTSNTGPIDRDKLKIDSDKAIELALKEPILEGIDAKAVSAKLERADLGPVWIIRIWAAKIQKPNEQADIGEVTLSAEDGKVTKSDLHINRID